MDGGTSTARERKRGGLIRFRHTVTKIEARGASHLAKRNVYYIKHVSCKIAQQLHFSLLSYAVWYPFFFPDVTPVCHGSVKLLVIAAPKMLTRVLIPLYPSLPSWGIPYCTVTYRESAHWKALYIITNRHHFILLRNICPSSALNINNIPWPRYCRR